MARCQSNKSLLSFFLFSLYEISILQETARHLCGLWLAVVYDCFSARNVLLKKAILKLSYIDIKYNSIAALFAFHQSRY